jgi:cupin fold WbuC family metalloprotein
MTHTNITSAIFLNQQSISDYHLELLSSLTYSETGTRRICFHESNQSALHIMLVQATGHKNFPRHRHTDSDEFTTVVRGGLEITAWFDGLKSPPQIVVLGRDFSGEHATLIPRGVPHATRPLSESSIYLEVKLGPFNRDALQTL